MANQADAQTHLEKADALFLGGQYEEATVEYAKAIEFGDSNVTTLNSWGVALRRLKKYDDAIEKFKQATLADPKYASAFHNWGNALYTQKKYDEAIAKYELATELDPNNAITFNNLGNVLYAQKNYDEAIAKYKHATDLDSNDAITFNNWGNVLYAQKNYDEAIAKYKHATELDSNDASFFNNWGLALYDQKKYDEAIEQYKQATIADRKYAVAFNNWGNALYDQKKYDEAIEQYKQATLADPKDASAFNNWGNALSAQKKYDEAIEQYKQATLADPQSAAAFGNWGNALFAQKKYDDAIAKYKQATELDLNNASAFNIWGLTLSAQKKYDDAIAKYKQATELDPNDANAYFNWGYALYTLKRYGDVVDKYQQAIKANPNSVDSVYAAHNVADFLQRQGKYKESLEAWKKARQAYEKYAKDRDIEDAGYFQNYGDMLSNGLGRLTDAEKIYIRGLVYDAHHAGILIGLVNLHLTKMEDDGEESPQEKRTRVWQPSGKQAREAQASQSETQKSAAYWKARDAYKKAESILQRQRAETKDISLSLQLGELYLKVEEFTAAEAVLVEAMGEDADSPQPCADLGVLYSRKGDYTRAVQYFEQALQKDIDDLAVRSNLAEACLKAKLTERAEVEYKKILGVTAFHVESHIGLGEVYTAMGDAGDGDRFDEAISCFDRGITQGQSPYGSKRLKKKDLSAALYSRGYAKVKLYETSKRLNDEKSLHEALDDFTKSYKNDSENHKAKRSIEKLEKRLDRFSKHSALEKIGPALVTFLSVVVFSLSQANFFFGIPGKQVDIGYYVLLIPGKQIDIGYYVLLTFGSLMFILAGLSLTQLLKFKVAGIELEKSAVDQITTSGSLGISK